MLVLKQFRYLLAALLFTSLANYVSATPAVEQFHLRIDGSSIPLDNTPLPLFINNQNTSIPVDFANRQYHRIHITSLTDSRPVTMTLLFDGPLVLHDTNEDIDASVYSQNDGFYRVQIHLPGGETQNSYELMLTGGARLITDKLEAEVPEPRHSHSDQIRQKKNCLSEGICDLDYLIRYQPPGEQYIQQQQTWLQNLQAEDVIVMMMSVAGSSDNNPPGKDGSEKPDRSGSSKKTPARDDQESSEDKQKNEGDKENKTNPPEQQKNNEGDSDEDKQKNEGDKENKTNPPEQQENNEGDSDEEELSNFPPVLDLSDIPQHLANAAGQSGAPQILMIDENPHAILDSISVKRKMGLAGTHPDNKDGNSDNKEGITIVLVEETTITILLVLDIISGQTKTLTVGKHGAVIRKHCCTDTKPKHNKDKDPDDKNGGGNSGGSPI